MICCQSVTEVLSGVISLLLQAVTVGNIFSSSLRFLRVKHELKAGDAGKRVVSPEHISSCSRLLYSCFLEELRM